MDGFIQIVLDLIMDGSLGAAGDRKAPTAVRAIWGWPRTRETLP